MELSRVNANLLVALDLLLTEQCVGRAAERHGVTPSAMSHSLRALRELFGDPILIRTARGMTPTPLAAQLRAPLHRALRELERAIAGGAEFDPARSDRGFVIVAPDFVSTLLLGALAPILEAEAPGVDVEIRPVRRSGSARHVYEWDRLAEGEVDLVVAALLEEVAELRHEVLYAERFVCVVREDHPRVGDVMDLVTYASLRHAVITISDERSPTWIDEALAEAGLTRHVALRTRSFLSAPLVVASSELVLTCPYQLARYFADRLPLRVLEPPVPLPTYRESVGWHPRYDADPGLRWLRGALRRAAGAAFRP